MAILDGADLFNNNIRVRTKEILTMVGRPCMLAERIEDKFSIFNNTHERTLLGMHAKKYFPRIVRFILK
jgi:hypothetical protein